MWQINEVIKVDGELFRILQTEDGEVVWISLSESKPFPVAVLYEALRDLVENEQLERTDDPFQYLAMEYPEPGSIAFEKREKALSVISPIIFYSF